MSFLIITSLSAKAQYLFSGCVLYNSSGAPILSEFMYVISTGRTTTTGCNGKSVMKYNTTARIGPLNLVCHFPTIPKATPSNFRNCIVGTQCGIIRSFDITDCPIDGYVGYLFLPLAVVAVFYIRKNCSVSSSIAV